MTMYRKSDGPIFIPQTTANCLIGIIIIGPRRDKTCLWGFQQTETQTSLLIYRS